MNVSSRIIPGLWVCDGDVDCGTSESGIDSSDEDPVKCIIFNSIEIFK